MPGRNYIQLIAVILFACCNLSFSQEREYIYDHFNTSNGLISDNVYKVFIDREGFAWIITYNGLQKYNGYEFETYTARPGVPGTLTSNFVMDMFEDRDGDLIVVLEDGIDIYNKQKDRFKNLLSNLPFTPLRRDEISRLASVVQDRSGSIWVTCNNHLVRIDSTKEDFFVYQDEFKGNFVLNRDSMIMWIITDQAIKKYELESKLLTIKSIQDIPGPVPVKRLNTIYYDSEHICWLGTSDGLFIYDEEHDRFLDPDSYVPWSNALQRSISNRNITAIYEDFRKDLWIASGALLFRINRVSGHVQVLKHEIDNPNTVLDEQITGIHGNHSGIIWVTYLNKGFTRMNIQTRNFGSYRFRVDRDDGLGGNSVRSVFKDPAGFIWVGLYNDGLDRIDPSGRKISHFRYDPLDTRSICSNYISSLFLDGNERLWVGSHDNGLCYADQVYGEKLFFTRPDFLNESDEIYHILADSLGRIWFGTRTGLGMYNYENDRFHWVLKDHNVQSFLFDHHTIWIASWNYGLCRLDFSRDQFNADLPSFDTATSVYFNEVFSAEAPGYEPDENALQNCISIYRDGQSNIWVGTFNSGLAKAENKEEGFRYELYDVSEGAPGNAVYGVAGDREGNIWISTEHGIGKFDPVTEVFENYYRTDGLLSNYFMWKSYHQAPDGELFFGCVNGLNFFYPHEIEKDTVSPTVIVTELRIQNRLIRCGETVNGDVVLDRHISYQDTLVLNHRNSYFSFTFSAPGHMNPDMIRYACMLDGFDDHWIVNAKGNRSATYNNLSPGTYHFRVKASENESVWQDGYVEKTMIILPPWWKTSVAIAIYILLIGGLIFLIFHTLFRFISLRNELIYSEKLHQSKLMFFTNVSHEFKNPLSLIKAAIPELLSDKGLAPRSRKNLLVLKQNANNLLKLINELMEFRRTDAGISKLRSEKIDLTEFINEVAAQFECIADQKGIHFYIDVPDKKLNLWVDREKFRKIINNLLENACKHTGQAGLVTMSVVENPGKFSFNPSYHTLHLKKSKKELNYIGILVSDSGVGISGESLPKIFDRFYQIEAEHAGNHIGSGIGLALVKNLVLMHHGDIQVASERGKGTEILVLLPLGDRHLSGEERLPAGDRIPMADPVIDDRAPLHYKPPGKVEQAEKRLTHPRILIVEDHEALRTFLKDNLSEDYDIMEASNGAEGIEQLRNGVPDLIIADWIMPVMDGASFLREVKSDRRTDSIPVILLTARDEMKETQEGLGLGADQVITKPFNLQLLRAQVQRIIENNRARIRKYSLEYPESLVNVRGDRETRFIEQVEQVIREHIRESSLNAALIAREMGISRTALYARIKEVSGLTMGEYIQKMRLRHAIKLMLYERASVSEVCVMVGISSSSYLIRLFKKYYHTTPGEYIRNYLKTVSN